MEPNRISRGDEQSANTQAHARSDEAFSKAWQAVSQSPQRPWTLDEISLKAGCNKQQLRDWAIRSFGRSPMRQILHLRLVRSAQLLLSSQTEEDTARTTGFGSIEAFRIAFTRWTGQSPDDYRRRPAWGRSAHLAR
jgi:AraC-like DNA-binding protein